MSNRLVLYTRAGCHLCSEMRARAEPIAAAHGLAIEPVDIDDDLDLLRRYNVKVPVLALDGREVCHHFLDTDALTRALTARDG